MGFIPLVCTAQSKCMLAIQIHGRRGSGVGLGMKMLSRFVHALSVEMMAILW